MAEGVRKSFPVGNTRRTHDVLKGVSLTVEPGEWVALMGASGSGKTTFLRCASGLTDAGAGTITIDGHEIAKLTDSQAAELRRTTLAYVFQNYNLIDELSVEQNIALPIALDGADGIPRRVQDAMGRTGISDLSGRTAADLSGGEQQRVAIARAVAQQPVILFADEPTGALDTRTSHRILELFRELTELGIGVLMVTHDLFAATRADRVVVLRDGVVERNLTRPTEQELFDILHADSDDESNSDE